ncbi:HAD family hydrolase [Truepera radiovictrix]|uniref:HAD-superfamily hydrolase, subfamily IA, variant 3 n=1 Tax=Truepera radiovictrix (strain DSM 17093 / CIP 108686 / LMG 22925 / RQ-24) TaxID=649638 RepID=D7CXF8_TRURR|nr:HAD family hydrolase [Truepera radiovictrix]ADI13282.1 HAD-superfamily hydrolase, subfamily IA, variant 3 [Truepera radiovictrix DSM 17093]WMT58154.1 HAD family hydrolase [Truepera radiovictrix]
MGHPKAVLLDVDGTLVDSNDAHARAYVDALKAYGYDVPFEKVRPLIGMGGDKLLPQVIDVESDAPLREEIDARRGEIFKSRYLPDIKPFPGVRELLERLRRDGLTLVAASSAKEDEADALLERAGVADLIDARTSSDDAENSKPDPDILQAALERAGVSAQEALLLGDTPYDLQAAAPLGLGVVALRCGGWRDEDLLGALAVYDDPQALLAGYDASPLAPEPASAPGDV